MEQHVTTKVQVNVFPHRRRRWFPLLGVIGFTIALFWPKALWHGTFGTVAEVIWVVLLGLIWGIVLVVRSVT